MVKLWLYFISISLSLSAYGAELTQQKINQFPTLSNQGFTPRSLSDDRRFDPDKFVKIEFDILKFSPSKLVPLNRVFIDDFTIETTVPAIVYNLYETNLDVRFEITGFTENNIPAPITPANINVVYKDRHVPFNLIPFKASEKKVVFDLILDDSGSMSGEPITKLSTVVDAFMKRVDGKGYLCRITWFSSSYEVMGDYEECGIANFGTTIPRGEYGGTAVIAPLANSLDDLAEFPKDQYNTNILLVGDGYDSSIDSSSLDWEKEKAHTKTFFFSITDNPQHGYDKVADFVLHQQTDFDQTLFNYMVAMEEHSTTTNTIVVKKNELLSLAEKKMLREAEKKRLEEEAQQNKAEETLKKKNKIRAGTTTAARSIRHEGVPG